MLASRLALALLIIAALPPSVRAAEPLPCTAPLELEGDIASQLVDGVDRFLLRKIEESAELRSTFWRRDFSSKEAYAKSTAANRGRLAHILGVRDERVPFHAPEFIATTQNGSLIGRGENYEIHAVRWPVLGVPGASWKDARLVYGEGLLLVPIGGMPSIGDVVVIPDADETPEQLAGLVDGVPLGRQYARGLAAWGARVLVPTIISRERQQRNDRANLTNREYLHRSAFELGRTLPGLEVQKVLAAVDWFVKEAGDTEPKVGVAGYGEGGMIALFAAALDDRIDCVYNSGYFGERETIWQQPIDRNLFGLLNEFGDAELLSLVYPRSFVIKISEGPAVSIPGDGGAPAKLEVTSFSAGLSERNRFLDIVQQGPKQVDSSDFIIEKIANQHLQEALTRMLRHVGSKPPESVLTRHRPKPVGNLPDAAARQRRQIAEIDQYNQWLLRESEYVRKEFMSKLDTSSLEKYEASVEPYRVLFAEEVIGRFDDPLLPANPRSRQAYDKEKWTGYEVVLDVFPDVIAYGVLLVPKDLKEGERRPVVVCQHGLEGRPQHVIEGDHAAYHDFAARLCERGFVVFAPQNLYIFEDRFRTLQRKANPLGKTLFSIMVPQHQQITDWLKTLPFVDGERIGFYGLSYGGKSAMRIPALVKNYCLSICSADFNEWVWKNASTRSEYSYVWSGEYEIFEWDLGSTFNYAEMAALIAPRPFMVERGHFDGVAPDEMVAYEYAKVRHLYAAKLGIGDRTEIEFFVGPHTINGKGTFDFLHRHLNWPKPAE